MPLHLNIGARSECGARPFNNDALCYRPHESLLLTSLCVAAMADGIGTARMVGDVARAVCKLSVHHCAEKLATISARTVLEQVFALSQRHAETHHAQCSLTVLVLRNDQLWIGSAGDTRLYRWRNGELRCLTADHRSVSAEMGGGLVRAVGLRGASHPDISCFTVHKHDRYVVVSDGVYDAIPLNNLQQLLAAGDDAAALANRLITEAIANQTQDNASALVVDVLDLQNTLQHDHLTQISSLPLAEMPPLSSLLDDYQIDALIARTRTHDVCRATDCRTQEAVVLKFARTTQAPVDQIKANLIHELTLSARLHHPQWVVARAPFLRQSALYLVYPFIAGKSLHGTKINRYGLRQLLRFGIELCQLLMPLHQQGVVHADLKPENILRGDDGKLYLIDFSVASESSAFNGGQLIGTPNFIAPEIWRGNSPSAASDQYALAATLYQLATGGSSPYGEIEAFSQPSFKSYRSLREHRDDLPLWFDLLLQRALHPDPQQRFADCHAFSEALHEGLQHGIGVASPIRPQSWLERDPLKFYQTLCAILAFALLISWLIVLH